MYVELHAASAFSFLEGASLPEALVERAAALDYPAIALLDRNGVYGAPRLHQAAKKAGLKALVGAELLMGGETSFRLPVLVASAEGYKNLCRVLSKAHMRAPKGHAVVTLDDLDGQAAGLIAL